MVRKHHFVSRVNTIAHHMDHRGRDAHSASSPRGHRTGNQFNAHGGTQNISTGDGVQLPGATVYGNVNVIHSSPNAIISEAGQSRKERENQTLRLLDTSLYRDRKDRNPAPVLGTCEWFVSHDLFRTWQGEEASSKILWVSADPGCGKSVLTKHLVDSVLRSTETSTVCYFFFKDDFEDQRNIVKALCCLLHQLFKQKGTLLSDELLHQFDISGQRIASSFVELWETLVKVAEDNANHEIICLLDAVDECEVNGRNQLSKALCELYGTTNRSSKLKFLVTSRPYREIGLGFQPLDALNLPVIHLSGESDVEMKKIVREIDLVIRERVKTIKALQNLKSAEEDSLLQQLRRVPNRTYLWVHLTLDLIERALDIDKKKIRQITSQLPQTINEAYDQILSKTCDPQKATKVLHLIIAARRPLTLEEMILALTLDEEHRCYDDLDLDSEARFRGKIRDICGLVTIIDSKIFLLHQTVKEFLVPKSVSHSTSELRWKWSIHPHESHLAITKVCVWYLLLQDLETTFFRETQHISKYIRDHVFIEYSANHWADHFRELHPGTQKSMMKSILRICDDTSGCHWKWFRIYWECSHTNTPFPLIFTSLMTASYFGLEVIVKHLLKMRDTELDSQDKTYSRTALSWAAGNGFDNVVKVLLKGKEVGLRFIPRTFKSGANVNLEDQDGRTPLIHAIWAGNVPIIKQLVKAGARVDIEDAMGATPLLYAVWNGEEEVIRLLRKKRTPKSSEDKIEEKLLLSASEEGHQMLIKLILKGGHTNINVRDEFGRTPLLRAAHHEHDAIVQLLLDTGQADIRAMDINNYSLISWAARKGNHSILQEILDTCSVDINVRDSYQYTPLLRATVEGHVDIVRRLLSTGRASVDVIDNTGRTPLSRAVETGTEDMVNLLLTTGKADINAADYEKCTPFLWAVRGGNVPMAMLLLRRGNAAVDRPDYRGRTPFSWAAGNGHVPMVELLLDTRGVNVNSSDHDDRTALSWAAENGHCDMVKLLLETGRLEIDAIDVKGRTAVSYAAEMDRVDALETLLNTSEATIDYADIYGRTPLYAAVQNASENAVEFLLKTGMVDVNRKANGSNTSLSLACVNGREAIVKLLLDTGNAVVTDNDTTLRGYITRKPKIVSLVLDIANVDGDERDAWGQMVFKGSTRSQRERDAAARYLQGERDFHSSVYDYQLAKGSKDVD